MANPLAMFRKYQQAMLVIFSVMLMIVFTVGGIITQRTNRPQAAAGQKVAVSWKGGELTEGGLQQLRQSHNVVLGFLQAAMQKARAEGASPRPFPLALSDADEVLTRTWILAKKAQAMGVQVSDEAIVGWLGELTDGLVTPDEYLAILREIGGGRIGQGPFFDALRTELSAMQMLTMFDSGIFPGGMPPSPAVAWDLCNRVQRRLVVELLPLDVEEFLGDVEEPSPSDVQRLYDQHKERLPSPANSDPGFKRPLRRAFHYVKADMATAMAEGAAAVSAQEVEEYYNAHLHDFRRADLPDATPPAGSTDELDKLLDSLDVESPTSPDSNGGVDAGSSSSEGGDDLDALLDSLTPPETPSGGTDPPSDGGGESGDSSSRTTVAPPRWRYVSESGEDVAEQAADLAEEASEAAADAVDEATNTSDDESLTADDEVAIDEPESSNETAANNTAGEAPPDVEASGPEDAAGEGEGDRSNPPESEPATSGEATEAAESAEKTAPSDDDLGDLSLLSPASNSAEQTDSEAESPYRPLSEVEDQIRNQLASAAVLEATEASLNQVRDAMDAYYDKYLKWDIGRDGKSSTSPPAPPDIAALAESLGLKFDTIPLSDPIAAQEFELGRSVQYVPSQSQGYRPEPFVQRGYAESIQLFRAVRFGREYVFWATEQEEEHVPKLDECREDVVRAWKRKRAVDPAKQRAEQMAQEARDSGKSLVELYVEKGYSVFEPEAESGISWMTPSSLPISEGGGIFLSQIPDLEFPNAQTMRDIFRLEPGEYGVTVNHPRTKVYVVHVKEETSTESQRRDRFKNVFLPYITNLSSQERNSVLGRHLENLEQSLGVTWHRTPVANR